MGNHAKQVVAWVPPKPELEKDVSTGDAVLASFCTAPQQASQ